jgi:putative DNA-invertase from lambdoid prophage Rac
MAPAPTAVSYHRVSTVDRQDPSLARDELRRAAELRGLTILEEIEETGSGARNDRPGLRRVLELAASGKITHVLVWKLDRFGRSALDLLSNVQALERMGVAFVATSQAIEISPTSGAMGRLMLTMLSAVAEFERSIIVERTRLGVSVARQRGKRLGRPSTAIPSGALARAAELRTDGASWSEVAIALKAAGFGSFSPKTLARRAAG